MRTVVASPSGVRVYRVRTATPIGPLPVMAKRRSASSSETVQTTSAGKPIIFMFSAKVAPTARVSGPPLGKFVWVMLHCPYASQSVSWDQSCAADASMRDSAVTSAMRPPLLVGYVRRKVAPAGGTFNTDDLSDMADVDGA